MNSTLYYEAHVTIEPTFDEKLTQLQEIAGKFYFRVADLLMQKRTEDTPERSKNDTFATTRHKNWEVILARVISFIAELQANGFKVWRYKIEDTLLDSNINDERKLVNT